MIHPGWGRCGVSYGPFERRAGLALGVFMINGHNLSQTYELASVPRRIARWAVGSGAQSVLARALAYLGHTPREKLIRKIRRWHASRRGRPGAIKLMENLAVGFFPGETPTDPLAGSSAFVVHGTEHYDNGDLWANVGGTPLCAFESFQNNQVYYVVILREHGAAYYMSGPPGAHGLGAYPKMRPIAIDPHEGGGGAREIYAGVHQSVLSEIGFTNDTRVYGARVAQLGGYENWYGSAMVADTLTGDGALGAVEHGSTWNMTSSIVRTDAGATGGGLAWIAADEPSGLIHAMVRPGGGLLWRVRDEHTHWRVIVEKSSARIERVTDGDVEIVGSAEIECAAEVSVQVLDDGGEVGAYINGVLVGERIGSSELGDACGVGFVLTGESGGVRAFEAHAREVAIPGVLDMGSPWLERGERVVIRDGFAGDESDFEGRKTECGGGAGGGRWTRVQGKGAFHLTGDGGVRTGASVERPNPGRTIYAVDWDEPGFAELEVELMPPGSERGQGQRSRAGFVFIQDAKNQFLLNLWNDDRYVTTSISTFYLVNGFEDIYDAVWTCMGEKRVHWGEAFRLRAAFDGLRYAVYVNDEPVLYRSLDDVYPGIKPLAINKVGLLANWEWGNDTGSEFRDFEARGR